MRTLYSIDPLTALLGAATVAAVAIAEPASSGSDMVEACCSVTAVDARTGAVTVRHGRLSLTWQITLADPAQARGVRVGQQVSFSTNPSVLALSGRNGTPLLLPAASIRQASAEPVGTSGAVASAASSSSTGTFRRDAPRGGKCAPIKETPTQQCVLTHDLSGEGKGCEYFCVPIR